MTHTSIHPSIHPSINRLTCVSSVLLRPKPAVPEMRSRAAMNAVVASHSVFISPRVNRRCASLRAAVFVRVMRKRRD